MLGRKCGCQVYVFALKIIKLKSCKKTLGYLSAKTKGEK